jgi:hypothetical protein
MKMEAFAKKFLFVVVFFSSFHSALACGVDGNTPAALKERQKEQFSYSDANKDGNLSPEEYLASNGSNLDCLKSANGCLQEDRISIYRDKLNMFKDFQKHDKDQSGDIDFNEWSSLRPKGSFFTRC